MKNIASSSAASENSTVAAIRSKKKPLSAKELAAITGLSVFTIYDWANANPPRIPRMRMGSRITFDPKQTADWLQERCG